MQYVQNNCRQAESVVELVFIINASLHCEQLDWQDQGVTAWYA